MENREIIVSPLAFHAPKVVQVPHGASIHEIVASLYPDLSVIVEIDGIPIPHNDWNIIPSLDSHVLISLPLHGGGGGGGKNPLRTLLTIAVVVAAMYVSGGTFATAGGWFAAGSTSAAFAAAGVMTAGMMLVNALAPIRPPELGTGDMQSYNDSPTYSLTGGSNRENPWGSVPVNLGVNRVYPPLGAKSYTEIVGGEEYLRMLVVWGYGPLKIEDIKIGDTLLSSYDDYELQTREGWSTDTDITLFPSQVTQTVVNVLLTATGGIVTRTAEINVDRLSVDIIFPNGLVTFTDDGSRDARRVDVKIQYREVGAGSWTLNNDVPFIDRTTSAVRWGTIWHVDKTKEYEIGLTRITADTTDAKIIDKVYWSSMKGELDEHPIDFPYPVSASAIRIKATDQLSGMIDSLNGIVSSYCPVWDDVAGNWGVAGNYAVTNNPAALMRWALMGNANARARVSTQIDNAILGEWYEFCETEGYTYNMYRDYKSSVWNTCADIASTGRASPNVKDGLWAVTVDTGTQTLVQHITPRNSWGFKAEKVLFTRPHAFRIKFINKDNGYIWDERIVYDDGYNSGNATLFESIEFPGITDPNLIWKFGRFHIAQARLRPEMYSLYMDFEHLVCRRGDKVRVSHDVPLWGSGWGRVKSLPDNGTHITHITLDESITMEAATAYSCRFRLASGDTLEPLAIKLDVGETAELELDTPLLIASGPEVGDLAMFGVTNSETVELLVHSIKRAGDFTAQIFLIDVASAIYTADTGEIPAFDPQTTTPIDVTTLPPDPPTIIDTEAGTAALEMSAGSVISRILVYLSPPTGTPGVDRYRTRYRLQGGTVWQYAPDTGSMTVPIFPVTDLELYEVQAQAISVYGVPSLWTGIETVLVTGQSELPSDVTGLSCNIVDTTAHLSWSPISDLDLSHYRIRWSSVLSGATWAASVDVVKRVGKPATSVTAPALVGTYLIKAVDFKGNESETAGSAITNIARVAGMNYIEEVTGPPWVGTGDGVFYSASLGGLVLDSENDLYDVTDLYAVGNLYVNGTLESEGTYAITETIDLDGVFTSRLSANLTVSGDDLLSDLYDAEDLYDFSNLYASQDGQYSAELEIRTTKDDPDAAPDWTSWQAFIVGDYTARSFQFRIRLEGTPPGITPIVTAISVEIDMPDRVIGFNDTIEVGGTTVSFSPAFYAVPEIGISVSNGQEGDKYTISAKDESEFTIAFTNGGGAVERNISGIARAYGYLEI